MIKTEIILNTPKIPDVGQFWHHTNDSSVYLRISDNDGLKIYPGARDTFFSLDIQTLTVRTTPSYAINIIILKIDEPLKFTEV